MAAPDLIIPVVSAIEAITDDDYVHPDLTEGHTNGFQSLRAAKLIVDNGDANPLTINFTAVRACSQGFLHGLQDTIGAGERREFGPFDSYRYKDIEGFVRFTLSGVGVNPLNVGVLGYRLIPEA